MVSQIAQDLTSLTTVGDGPKIIRSKNVAVRVEKNLPASFDGKVIEESKSVIVLPPLEDVLSNVNETIQVMGCQVNITISAVFILNNLFGVAVEGMEPS